MQFPLALCHRTLVDMAGAVLVLALATHAVLASSSNASVHLDLQVDDAVPTNNLPVLPLPYNIRGDRSRTVPNGGFYVAADVPKATFNSQRMKNKHLKHKMKYSSQVKNKDAVSPHPEQADEYTDSSFIPEGIVAEIGSKIIITVPNSDDYPQGEIIVEEEKTTDEFMEQTFGTGLELLQLRQKLQKLDFYFNFLGIVHEDCRQRILCEVLKEPSRFYPFSGVLDDATSFYGDFQSLNSELANTTEGVRLLSYMEAAFRAQEKSRSCGIFKYQCPFPTEDMINYDSLCLWGEMVRWLTIHVVARKSEWNLQPLPSRTFTPWA